MGVSLQQMDTPLIHVRLTVEEVLQRWPDAFSVFMVAKTKCPGCFMQQFCTLKDVAETYQISLPDLIKDLQECAQTINLTQRSTL
jgi:hybrid cluster-associated redox disulfide protein